MFDKNAWQREDRKKFPEKWRKRDLLQYQKRSANPEYGDYQRNKLLKHRYGITLEQKLQMYEKQNGLCAVCSERLPEDYRKAHVDHCHESEKVRGLVHWSCNKLLGFVENNMDLIELIYVYLGAKRKQ